MIDPEVFGAAMGEAIRAATAPLLKRIEELEAKKLPDISEAVTLAIAEIAPAKDGKDGERGEDGRSFSVEDAKSLLEPEIAKWALDFERRAQDTLQKSIDRFPKPKDGIDGVDALGFDDLSVTYDDERTITLKFQAGDKVKEFAFVLPIVLDKGYYQDGNSFEKSDGVTFGGSYWIAQKSTSSKPEIGNTDWRLAVRKGRDAKTPAKLDAPK